jgi:hypothetical protein
VLNIKQGSLYAGWLEALASEVRNYAWLAREEEFLVSKFPDEYCRRLSRCLSAFTVLLKYSSTSSLYLGIIRTFYVMSHVSYVMSHVFHALSHVSYVMSPVSYVMSHVSHVMSHVSYVMSHVSYVMSHISYVMSHVSYAIMWSCQIER